MGGLKPLTNGTQVLSLSNSTAVALNSTVTTAHVVVFSVETNDVRMWYNSAPTLNTGILWQKDDTYILEGVSSSITPQFQRSTGSATVHAEGLVYES